MKIILLAIFHQFAISNQILIVKDSTKIFPELKVNNFLGFHLHKIDGRLVSSKKIRSTLEMYDKNSLKIYTEIDLMEKNIKSKMILYRILEAGSIAMVAYKPKIAIGGTIGTHLIFMKIRRQKRRSYDIKKFAIQMYESKRKAKLLK